ncbi:MAG TPA: OmpH family outer membrane protein [Acetobacteraceae bacterium]|nr:OmpH family outer membrane protein [Acetobacteraceae bacterium]
MFHHRLLLTAVAAVVLLGPLTAAPITARAQQAPSQEWFVPGQGQKAAPARPAARPATTPTAAAPATEGVTPDAEAAAPVSPQQLEVVLPPPPDVPPIQRGSLPPAAVIGVISVPDVMRGSTAYLAVDKELGVRRQKLNEDAQKEQTTLRDMGQTLTNDRAKMTPEQIRNKERELQDRIADSRRKFADRNRIIQEAGQYALAQIERTLRIVVQQVAGSRGMNLVLHGPQVALNIPEFDITQEVVTEMNKVLPSVSLPPDGVSVLDLKPTAAAKPAATPAAAKPAPKKP